MNITITGNLGGGKTSVCKELEKYGFKIITGGGLFRDIAREKGISVLELNELAKADRSIDDLIDNRTAKIGREEDNILFDSRLAWHFAPYSFKVFLLTDSYEAARRTFAGGAREAEEYSDINATMSGLKERADLERERFKELYDIDYYDRKNYDLIIESTYASPEQIAKEIMRNFEEYKNKKFHSRLELNTRTFYPAKSFDSFDKGLFDSQLKGLEGEEKLCMEEAPLLAAQNGYTYILEGTEKVFAALRTGRVFCCVDKLSTEADDIAVVTELSQSELADYEQTGDFKYLVYPDKLGSKPGFLLNVYGADGKN